MQTAPQIVEIDSKIGKIGRMSTPQYMFSGLGALVSPPNWFSSRHWPSSAHCPSSWHPLPARISRVPRGDTPNVYGLMPGIWPAGLAANEVIGTLYALLLYGDKFPEFQLVPG